MVKKLKRSIVEVFSNWKYILLSLIIAFLFLFLNLLLPNYKYIFNNFNLNTLYTFFIGGLSTTNTGSLTTIIIISILSGILVSMITYKIRFINIIDKKTTGVGSVAVFFGTLVPGCAACGFGLLPLLGYSGLLVALPFAGLELSWLNIILLVIAITIISNQIANKTCKK